MGLGLYYLHGTGTAQDTGQAEALIRQAAAQGWRYEISSSADQHYVIGLFYCLLSYPVPDRKKARGLFAAGV